MITAKEVVLSVPRDKLREMQCVRVDGEGPVSITVVKPIKLARHVIEGKRKNSTLSKQDTSLEAKRVEARSVSGTVREQLAEAERRTKVLKTQLNESQFALENLADESSRTEADLRAQVIAVGEALSAERERVDRLEGVIAAKTKNRQRLLAKRWETSETASRQLAEDGEFLQE